MKNNIDYEKKYNKLVEAIKVLQKTNPSDEGIQNWVNDNVSELKGSEDEKIKKAIISYIDYEGQRGGEWFGVKVDDIIAWLEKQGEQKPADKVEPKFHEGDIIINIHHRCDGNSRIREITSGKYIFDDGSYIAIKEQDDWELVEQKSAWSEEDEEKLDNAIYACQNIYGTRSDIAFWLKSLKQRMEEEK